MNGQRSGGIASAMNDARSGASPQPASRPGEGVSDAAELARIIALVRASEVQNSSVADMVIGAFRSVLLAGCSS
jgi:hypothetical protein